MNSTNSCLWWRSKELNSSSVLRYCVHVHQFVIENPPVGLLTTTITHQLMEEDSLQVNSMYPSVSCTCSCKAVEEQGKWSVSKLKVGDVGRSLVWIRGRNTDHLVPSPYPMAFQSNNIVAEMTITRSCQTQWRQTHLKAPHGTHFRTRFFIPVTLIQPRVRDSPYVLELHFWTSSRWSGSHLE